MFTGNPLEDLMNQIINNRMYDILSSAAEESGDQQLQKMIESVKVVADKHNMEFTEVFYILLELSTLLRTEE